ncbi:MAG TPA: muconolactone Delta-isomerase family protein [Actinotalea sp.]|nr:muconolactone Delta-isomerase family protein [Actinotalea sp.]
MEVLALEHDGPSPQGATAELLRAEALRVYELEQAGVVRRTWFRAERPAAVLLLEVETLEDARAAVSGLPLVAAGVIDLELVPLAPYPGLARLWTDAVTGT